MEFVDLVMDRIYVPEEELSLFPCWPHLTHCQSVVAAEDQNSLNPSQDDENVPCSHIPEELRTDAGMREGDSYSVPQSPQEKIEEKTSSTKKCERKAPKQRKSIKKKTKNILINFGTGLRKFVKSRVDRGELARFEDVFGARKKYKGLKEFTRLFQSDFQPLCLEFFSRHVLRYISTSNVNKKMELIRYIGIMRQAAIIRELTHLEDFGK